MGPRSADIDALAEAIAGWANIHGLFRDLDAKEQRTKAATIATFVQHCSPPAASPQGIWLAAQITGVFFYLDDLPVACVEPEARQLLGVLQAERPIVATPGLAPSPSAALREYLCNLELWDTGCRYRGFLQDLFEAMIFEAQRAQQGPWSWVDFEQHRLGVIFVRQYVWSWLISERVELTDAALAACEPCFRLASGIVAVVNDLGSVERDRAAGGVDANLILLVEQNGFGAQEALDLVVKKHETLTNAYSMVVNKLLSRQTSQEADIVAMIDCVVQGNFSATVALSRLRYPNTLKILERLNVYYRSAHGFN
jgi:hypothetical protein